MNQSTPVPWSPDYLRDLLWWLHLPRLSRGVSPSGVSRPRLLVRRLGRRVGGSSGPSRRFRPLGRVGVSSPCQRQGAACRSLGSPPLPVVSVGQDSGCLLRQRHCRGISAQSRGHQVSLPQLQPPQRITAVRSIFLRTGTLSHRARTPFSSPGMVFRRMHFLRGPSFPRF